MIIEKYVDKLEYKKNMNIFSKQLLRYMSICHGPQAVYAYPFNVTNAHYWEWITVNNDGSFETNHTQIKLREWFRDHNEHIVVTPEFNVVRNTMFVDKYNELYDPTDVPGIRFAVDEHDFNFKIMKWLRTTDIVERARIKPTTLGHLEELGFTSFKISDNSIVLDESELQLLKEKDEDIYV